VEAEQHAAASKMGLLRQIIDDLIEQETGRKHIAAVASEARAVGTRLEEERLPIAELQDRLRAQNERISSLQAATGDIRESLEKELAECIKRSTRNFTDLAPLLHADLDAQIKTSDVVVGDCMVAHPERKGAPQGSAVPLCSRECMEDSGDLRYVRRVCQTLATPFE
jgi:hypothetical protein